MSVATTSKPVLRPQCDSCRQALAVFRQVTADGSGFLLCSPCLTPIEGASLYSLIPPQR